MLFPQIHKFIFCIQISIFLITLPFLHSKVGEVYDNSLKIQSEKISRTLIFLCANKIEKTELIYPFNRCSRLHIVFPR